MSDKAHKTKQPPNCYLYFPGIRVHAGMLILVCIMNFTSISKLIIKSKHKRSSLTLERVSINVIGYLVDGDTQFILRLHFILNLSMKRPSA